MLPGVTAPQEVLRRRREIHSVAVKEILAWCRQEGLPGTFRFCGPIGTVVPLVIMVRDGSWCHCHGKTTCQFPRRPCELKPTGST
jgi:hypothetical protein